MLSHFSNAEQFLAMDSQPRTPSNKTNVKLPDTSFLGQIPDMRRELVSCIVEKLAKYLAGPDCGEDVVAHMRDEGIDGVAELPSCERVDGYGFLSWSCCERLNGEIADYFPWRIELLHRWFVR